ncbi:flavin monoamine oxidase family protein [Aspergillus candidus]|uniref:FAD/NAD(P)-binding domain-containing protein n=1 Tax=Aspergillus candidus TaxID=41067 RepID=A0A2I2FJK5_ASPCN|nr:FAD/NAD(P)-binding domain-containing protein [Aspergillus candidus]PLB40803.1 FAD/NAD(P)-binding domain-containing protein [Aspergillus candidus]
MGSISPHVAVIGAGFAGLRCADILVQNGARVTVFEARDRVGGRVHQTQIHNHTIDLGPNWIHGTGTNPMATLAETTNTTTTDFEEELLLIAADGKPVSRAVANKISEFLWASIEEAFEYSNAHKDTISPDRSLLDFFRERVDGSDFTPEEKHLFIETSRMWGVYVGDGVDRQSLKFFCLEECIDGSNSFVASTYKAILEHVSRAALQHADLRLNQPVVKIESKPRAHETGSSRNVWLTTAAGETARFDEVVVTTPLGWLKRNKSAFTPELPPRLTQAIDSISYGRLEKVYVTFPTAFWHTSNTSVTTNSNNPTTNATFVQFLDPNYTARPESITWNQECVSLAALPPHCAHPTLLFYTYGPCATHIVSNLANLPPTSPEYHTILDTFLHPFYSRLPNYTASSPSCKPLAFIATQWQNDPYAGNGSYCNFQIGLQQGDRDIEVLRAGLGADRGVWFAGEHTAPFVAVGTTTGAYWSGERAAGQVCEVYGLGRLGLGVLRDDSLPSAGGDKGSLVDDDVVSGVN